MGSLHLKKRPPEMYRGPTILRMAARDPVFKISKLFILFKLFLWHIVGEVKRGLEMATGRQGVLKIPGTRLRMEPATAS